ncbi:hypothetical protein K435DRAFT_847385 [Dendrothele bispora CBS 962.96]|uniref:Uncharacterized protein n=1 Tax=Dendrothele bispora (strain CBS 962.96) TaxID=1314807 RepID=A0A4V4HIZ1_DENBC|nr:hypothetical protein K435DRAFT_847385 [Dendrothele bispora CBS 962.96]
MFAVTDLMAFGTSGPSSLHVPSTVDANILEPQPETEIKANAGRDGLDTIRHHAAILRHLGDLLVGHPSSFHLLVGSPPPPAHPFFDKINALDSSMSLIYNKRQYMSTDSASEPLSSAVSYSSFIYGGYSFATLATSHSQCSSIDFTTPTSSYTPFTLANLSADFGAEMVGSIGLKELAERFRDPEVKKYSLISSMRVPRDNTPRLIIEQRWAILLSNSDSSSDSNSDPDNSDSDLPPQHNSRRSPSPRRRSPSGTPPR